MIWLLRVILSAILKNSMEAREEGGNSVPSEKLRDNSSGQS